eukprot:TRINITY_DN9359_c0_g1_i1.p1 TRINITY_DN9359_c0_g1~~TRINITY_DN9359_c0_g1_i1.p1  ORF type:complete len:456 (-),score=53.94 TRINITY_DN9359_c0_g1_i1:205-1521(-)
MHLAAIAALILLASTPSRSQETGDYTLVESHVGRDFFDKWTFYTGPDPTHGDVSFQSLEEAESAGLATASEDRVYLGVDANTVLQAGQDRKATKILSNSVFNSGLFVLRADHVPSACGAWPAWWMYGENSQHRWPRWGELDIVEAVHTAPFATATLHTREDCQQSQVSAGVGGDFDGQGWGQGRNNQAAKNCFVEAPDQFKNQGCGQKMPDGSFGADLNSRGGVSTWAAEWDPVALHIRVWFFPSGQEPQDLLGQQPKPDSWGEPEAFFSLDPTTCSANHFKNMRMVFDITFCGDYAGKTFQQACPQAQGMSCTEFVERNPRAFAEAYWSIRGLEVYQRRSYEPPGQPNRLWWLPILAVVLCLVGLLTGLAKAFSCRWRSDGLTACPHCGGRGYRKVRLCTLPTFGRQGPPGCQVCGGSGVVSEAWLEGVTRELAQSE